MQPEEAVSVLKTCIRNILGKPKIDVATEFVEFRDALLSETLKSDDHRVSNLLVSPYFFHKLTVSILLANIKKNIGAKLQHALANFNLIIPELWIGCAIPRNGRLAIPIQKFTLQAVYCNKRNKSGFAESQGF